MLDQRVELLRILDHAGTITAAATLLHRSPSGYSRQLRSLSRELGVELLEQQGREVRLTPAGKRVVEYAHHVLGRWQTTLTAVQGDDGGGGPFGERRIGAHPTALSALLAPCLDEISGSYPSLYLTAVETEPPRCFDQLVAGDIDACLVPAQSDLPPRTDPRFRQEIVLTESIDVLVSSTHRLADRSSVSLCELAYESWVLPGPERSGHQEVVGACHAVGFVPDAVHFAQDPQATADLVEATGAVALVGRFARCDSAVNRLPLDGDSAPERQIVLCTPAGRDDLVIRTLADRMTEHAVGL